MDYEKVIHALVDSIVEHPDSILIRELPSDSDKDVTLLIVTEQDDTARLIGKHGIIANSLREMMSVVGKTERKRIHLKFESFESEEEGK